MFTDSCFVSSTVVSNRFQETAQIVITKFSKPDLDVTVFSNYVLVY